MTLQAEKPQVVPLYAGFWRRGAAVLLDGIIVVVPTAIVNVALPDLLATIVNIAISCGYYAGFHSSSRQATPGKMAFGIKVTDLAGERIGIGRAIGRYFAAWLSAILLMIGYLMAAFTDRKRALHDMIAGTLVVNRAAEPAETVAGGGTMPLTGGVIAMAAFLAIVPVLGILAAVAIPAYWGYATRARVTEGIAIGAALKTKVTEARHANQPIGTGPVENTQTSNVREARIAADGVITVRMQPHVANGGSIVFTPINDANGQISSWTCHSDDIPDKLLPAVCRR